MPYPALCSAVLEFLWEKGVLVRWAGKESVSLFLPVHRQSWDDYPDRSPDRQTAVADDKKRLLCQLKSVWEQGGKEAPEAHTVR